MSGHLAGITVDAVREQLAALGHDDVSDDVIASFLTSLDHQVGIGHNLTSTSSSSGQGMTTKPDGGAVGGADTAVHDTAVHVRRHGDAPSSPSHKRNNASLRRYSSKYLAARTPGGSEISSSAETRVSADDEDPGAMTPSPSSAASKRTARATPNGTRVRPASGHRTAVLAIPTKCSPTTEPKASSSSKSHPKMKTPSSATTRHRRAHAPNADTHEDIIGWCAKRSVQPVTPHTTRTSSSSSAATPPSSGNKTKNKTSVIKSSMPVRPGTFTPGQRVRIDRVARAAQYNAVWSGDAYLERRGGDGTNSNKFPVFAGGAGGKVNATSRLRFDDMENADEATVFGTKPRVLTDIDVCVNGTGVYVVNGPRGGSWGRAQRKLTDGVNENRLDKGKSSSGFWGQKRGDTRAPMAGGFKTPGENRRDALRWEVRARMAAPPTF